MTNAMRWVGMTVATAVAVATCAALGLLTYEFFEIYGGDEQAGALSGALPSALPAAIIVAGAATAVFALAGRRPRLPALLLLAGLSLVLTAGIATGGAWLGTAAKQKDQRVAAAACSAQDRETLRELGTVPQEGSYGTGMADGSCQGYVAFIDDDQAASRLAAVRQSLTAAGWTTSRPQDEPKAVYRKDGQNMQVTVRRDKAVEVTFSLT